MTIAKRLIVLLTVPLVALFGLGVFTRWQLTKVEERGRFVSRSRIDALATLGNLSRGFTDLQVDVRNILLATSDSARQAQRRRFEISEADVNRLLQEYADHLLFSEQGRQLMSEFRTLSQEWFGYAKQIMALADAGRHDEATALLNGLTSAVGGRLNTILREWINNNRELAADASAETVRSIEIFRTEMTLAITAMAVLTASLGYLTRRKIVEPIRALESTVQTVAAGEYAKEIPFTTATDETGGLARSIDLLRKAAAQTQLLLTQTKRQEADLKRVNFQSDSALDMTKSGYWHVPLDDSGWYNSSERAARIFGDVPNSEWRYTVAHWAEHVTAGDAEAAKATLENFSATIAGTVPAYDSVYAYKRPIDGRIVWIHALGHVIKDATGKPTDMYGVTQDITDIKLAELAMKESEQRVRETEQFYRSVLELAPDGLMVADRTGVIRLANAQCEKLFGYSRDELIGQSIEILVPDSVRGRHANLRAGYHHAPTVRAMGAGGELKGRRKDGTLFAVEIGLSPLPAKGDEGAQVAASIRDITERKLQEAEILSAKQKAEEATQMKSMFLANMSHEIRTPMNAIIGLSHLALRTPLNAKQRDYVSKVHNAGTSLLAIINDILDFSKIEAGKIDLETTEFKLDDVISSVTTITAQKANEKGLEYLAQTAPGIPAVLLGDPLRLGQILTNLVNNSIKFTERGEVHLHAELLERTGEKCQLRFSIRDTGVGMSKEQSTKLFQPFTQADMSTTRKHGGTGLGLTICRRLVELMGGQISLESEPGVGTVFTFTVWLGIGQQKGSGKVIPEKLRKLRALIVDDNAAARAVIEGLLDGIVATTDVVSSGAEAIAAVQARGGDDPYDIIFMDWRMPGMDGLQASRTIKEDASLPHQPAIVLVTAFGREEVREEAERLQLEGFLVKPVTRSMVVDALVNVYADSTDQGVAVLTATSEGRRLDGMRVLLAEDNEINQQIACELLEGVGATMTVVSNGREAITRLMGAGSPPPFDVVLMDLQMPVMGGYEATAVIRADTRFAALPIIAMTAHATSEERQRCLAAGMNDHVSKPIDPGLLFETLGRFHRPTSTAPAPARTPAPVPAAAVTLPVIAGLDTKDGLARVAGNERLYLKLLRTFRNDQAAVISQIRITLAQGDAVRAERLAHSLKGVAGNLGARAVHASAGTVEKLIREKAPPPEIQKAVAALAALLDPLLAQLPTTQADIPVVEAVAADPAVTRAIIARLAAMLEDFDAGAGEFIEQNTAILQPAFAPADWTEFTQHARGYAFSEALALLQATGVK